jgi:4-amino-4-deoxy-L-arabinose transferase-like glycosyltransferase
MSANRSSEMSAVTESRDSPATERPASATASRWASDRTRRRIALVVTLVVLGWSIMELINLGLHHTTGPELYGVLVAAVAVGTGVLSLALLASDRRRVLASAAVLVLWAIIAVGGVAGTVAHIVGPVPGHGPVDSRPRPVGAPLVFTALGFAGGAALVYGQRLRAARGREP